MRFIWNFSLWIILLASLALGGYVLSIKKGPCEVPIEYTLGTFDTRFNISKSDFMRDVANATYIWEDAYGKHLFVNKDDETPLDGIQKYLHEYVDKYFVRKPVVINLIYDSRQQNATQEQVTVSAIDQTKQTADEIKQQFTTLQSSYKTASAEYQSLLASYYARQTDRATLEAKRLEVNNLANQINSLVSKYNYLVGAINTTVAKVNQSAGQEFEEGEYVSDSSGERINIYEFTTTASLTRVLAHEFGHAIGLEHNSNPKSIMYYLNSSSNMTPTTEDITALRAICNAK